MERKTLLLNSIYVPVQILTWETAIKMRYEGTADVLVEYTEEIRSPSVTWRLPAVMRLKKTSKRNKARQVRFSRTGVYQRDKYRCAYCRNKFKYSELTLDHIVARSRGGLTEWTNVTSACKDCNGAKGNKTCDEWGCWPATKPVIPRTLASPGPRIDIETAPPEWSGFVSGSD